MEQTDDRRKRLRSLREARNRKDIQEGEIEKGEKPKLKFRNYVPKSEQLKEHRMEVEPVASIKIAEDKEKRKDEEKAMNGEEKALNIAPKKPNWDLKRGIEKRMRKLERRTQRAIVELLRERIAKQQDEESDSSDSQGDEDDR